MTIAEKAKAWFNSKDIPVSIITVNLETGETSTGTPTNCKDVTKLKEYIYIKINNSYQVEISQEEIHYRASIWDIDCEADEI